MNYTQNRTDSYRIIFSNSKEKCQSTGKAEQGADVDPRWPCFGTAYASL